MVIGLQVLTDHGVVVHPKNRFEVSQRVHRNSRDGSLLERMLPPLDAPEGPAVDGRAGD